MDFINGNIAGYVGAIIVYPIDLVKSNMQLQQSELYKSYPHKSYPHKSYLHKSYPHKPNPYANGLDCIRQIVRERGIKKLYSGSFIQLVGVGPEKAIKLYVNQTLLSNDINPIVAGACSGLSQVVITNPIENIKIQYQTHLDKKINLIESVKMIGGLKKLYRGVFVCAMRDVPFSAIYWPTYSSIKNKLLGYNINNHTSYILSGMFAAIPSAYLVTPFDVIKTRIQALPDMYKTVGQTAKKIYLEEGFKAFFKGGGWRVAKSSPQFAITLYVYEILTDIDLIK